MAKSPSEFSKMYPTFWSGKTGKALRGDAEAQVIQHYLIDNQHTNMWGLYYLPKPYINHDTGHSDKIIKRVLQKLEELGFAYYDDETEYVFVVEMAHMQVGELKNGDKRIGSANRFYRDVHDNPFLGMFYDRYAEELAISEDRRGLEGASKGLTRGLEDPPKSLVRDYAAADADAPADGSKEVETKDLVVVERKFADDTQNLVDLWNDMAPSYYNRTRTVNAKLVGLIKKAFKQYPERQAWEEIIERISMSTFLRGKKWVDLHWVVKVSDGADIENYAKIMNGNFGDPDSGGMSDLARRNMEVAEQALNRMGIPTKAQSFIMKGITDGLTIEDGHSSAPGEASDGAWTDAEYREDAGLPGAPGGIYGGGSDQRDYLGDGQYE
jgi:hypothetical protein